jgi:hypothetical protein
MEDSTTQYPTEEGNYETSDDGPVYEDSFRYLRYIDSWFLNTTINLFLMAAYTCYNASVPYRCLIYRDKTSTTTQLTFYPLNGSS